VGTYNQVYSTEHDGVAYRVAEVAADSGSEDVEISIGDGTRMVLPAGVARQVASAILRRDVLRNLHRGPR
jgi:hypothetical protein